MKHYLRVILVCFIANLLNLLSAYIFYDWLHIPLFMDTIFTVAVTFYYGLIPGLVVAVLYNVSSVFFHALMGAGFEPINMLFAICGALIAFVTWLFARHKKEFRISTAITCLYLILIALCSSFASIFTSGFIDFIRLSYFQSSAIVAPIKEFTESFIRQKFSLYASCILGQIPIAFTDRVISTFLGYGVYRLFVKILGEEKWR